MARKGPVKVPAARAHPDYVWGSRPSDMYAPRTQSRTQGDITKAPPRITAKDTRSYGKNTPSTGFGLTGLTHES